MKEKVIVGMSGGVDSSLTALLLEEQGFEVIGVTIKLWGGFHEKNGCTNSSSCCSSPDAIADARAVANHVGVPYFVEDGEQAFFDEVATPFVESYEKAETPNPCIRCNEKIKFADLLRFADENNAKYIATGHFARIEKVDDRFCLKGARDVMKDQTYFMFSLPQKILSRLLFPLGNYTKEEVRELATKHGLPTAKKKESQDVCFIGDDGIKGFLKRFVPHSFKKGEVKLTDGTKLGEHEGMLSYTIGQRKGLGVAWKEPLFVTKLDKETNTVYLGTKEELLVKSMMIKDCVWHLNEPTKEGMECLVKNRYRSKFVPAIAYKKENGVFEVVYKEPQSIPSLGQACVIYKESLCIGGGWFCES